MNRTETPLSFIDPSGHRVAGLLATPSRSTDKLVILCHGFLSTKQSNTNRRLTELFLSHNIATYRFDWFGQGESDGHFADITISQCCDQLHHAVHIAHSRGYERIGIIGSSFGGLIALLVTPQVPEVAALGLKCPVPDFPEMLRQRLGGPMMARWREAGTITIPLAEHSPPVHVQYRFYEDSLSHHAYQAARALTQPVFIVHGDQDRVVPFHQIQELITALSGDRHLFLIAGADHQFGRPDAFRKMTAALADWMSRALTSCS